jgi:antitoxin component YwqK of YwqJK toxin-antitoxin module
MGQPAVIYYNNGQVVYQYWSKKDVNHRDRGLPSFIYYENGKARRKKWNKNGIFIKEERY